MSLKSIILGGEAAIKNELLKLEGKISTGTPVLIADITKLVNEVQTFAAKADAAIPIVTEALDSPLGAAIAAYLPTGAAAKAAVISLINDFIPFIQKAASPAVCASLVSGLSAQILLVENTAIADINVALRDITYIEAETAAL